ncbi:MFS transporter [Salinirubellus sp. GCM10025818]|uniref:MFS transporter n=1 Tax=Salinirubellus TaxID=2162630 RepID=UPI0030CDBD43
MSTEEGGADPLDAFRQFLALRRDVLVLSVAMFAFSLAFQTTSRYVPEYLRVLGAGAGVIGLYGSVGNLISAIYPYPGGALSDRVGSRVSLTLFGVVTTVGFGVWYLAPTVDDLAVGSIVVPGWSLVFLGLFLTQAWKSFGLGATFAVVKQSVAPEHLASGFASTETFRRVGFLVGPLLAAALLASTPGFTGGFRRIILMAVVFGAVATVVQHLLYDASEDSIGRSFEGLGQVRRDLLGMPETLRPLLVADTLVRFANGMVYVFFVIVVVEFLSVGFQGFGLTLRPDAYFGVLLGVEMVVALVSMVPVARAAERVGLKPVVALGFAVYAVFPALLIVAPANQWVLALLFAFSGLRFAGLPAHKALIVGPAERDAGGRVTGTYYLVRNTVVIPSAVVGGVLYAMDPVVAFGVASAIGVLGVAYFVAFGREFEAYA